jgi:hypothetical protein
MPRSTTNTNQLGPYLITCDMDDDVRAVRDFASAILLVSETMDGPHAEVINRLACQVLDLSKSLEERRGELGRLLHPHREHFEKLGWPGDRKNVIALVSQVEPPDQPP